MDLFNTQKPKKLYFVKTASFKDFLKLPTPLSSTSEENTQVDKKQSNVKDPRPISTCQELQKLNARNCEEKARSKDRWKTIAKF